MSDSVLALERVSKRYGAFAAVNDLSFTVGRGEIFGFLGPNGAGKTTTLRMALDIIPATEGRITILGSSSATPVRKRIGYLPEERGLYRKMRAAETIAYFARLRGVAAPAARDKAMTLLEEFGLGAFARSKIEALSKGMAQKVQLLSTIAHDPEFLILDEPFSGLDPLNQATLEDLVRRMKREGRTIVFSTHVMPHAERLCDRFLILARGEKRFEGRLIEARALFPRRINIRARSIAETLATLPGVHSAKRNADRADGYGDFTLDIAKEAAASDVLKAATARGFEVERFEEVDVSLHDIFVSLAQDAPKEARS